MIVETLMVVFAIYYSINRIILILILKTGNYFGLKTHENFNYRGKFNFMNSILISENDFG